MHRSLGKLVIFDTAESLSKKRSGALKLCARAARVSILIGVPLAGVTAALMLYLRPEISMASIITILAVPIIGPLMIIQATFEYYFTTTLTLSSEGLKKKILGGTTMIRWPRVKSYSLKPAEYISDFSFLSLRLGFAASITVLVPADRETEVDRFIRRWVHK